MRSKLFVPASRPELFSKALASAADGLSFDLEDSVRPDKKAEARVFLVDFFKTESSKLSKKLMIVRVNSLDSPYFLDDIRSILSLGFDIINLPKAESVDDIQSAVKAIEKVENELDLNANHLNPVKLLINIETPKSLRLAFDLASAHERVMGLQLGLADLFEPYGIDRKQVVAVQQAMFNVSIAAHEAGVQVFDGAYTNIADKAGYKAEAQLAKSLGFTGKSCIHPSQIEMANAVFCPSSEEIAYSLRVLEAEAKASRESLGAFVVDGKMIDPPFANRARAIVLEAKKLGLLE